MADQVKQIISNTLEGVREGTVRPIVKEVKSEVDPTGGIKEGWAQMVGVPLPDSAVAQMQQEDDANATSGIAKGQEELERIKATQKTNTNAGNKTTPKITPVTPQEAEIIKRDIGMTHEQAQQQLAQTLHREAEQLGQTNPNNQEQLDAQRKQQEADEEARKKEEAQQKLSAPIGLPGSHTVSAPVGRPVINQRQSTGETLKKRDT